MDIKLVESIKQLIAEGKTENAITQFLDNIHDDELKNDLIVISGKFKKIKREENVGLEGYDKISQEKNKINSSLLEILNSIKIENTIQEESEELKNLKIKIQEKINALYAIDTEYWGEITKIDKNTLVITYNPHKYAREGIVTLSQHILMFRLDLWSLITRIPLYFFFFIISGYWILEDLLGYDLSNIQYDCFYIFGLFCLFTLGFELFLRTRLRESMRTFEMADEIRIDLKIGTITKLRTEHKIRRLFRRKKTISTKNQIQYLDKCYAISIFTNHITLGFKKGKILTMGFFKYDTEAIKDFAELVEFVANHFSINNPIEKKAYYGRRHPHNSSFKNTPV